MGTFSEFQPKTGSMSNSQQPERSGDRLERSESNDRREWQRMSNFQGNCAPAMRPSLDIGFECWILDIQMPCASHCSALPGFAGVSSLAHIQVCTQLDRLSRAIKRIRVSVAVKSAMKCPFKCALSTLPRTLNRTLRRHPYSDTLNRTAYAIPSHCWS